MNHYFPDRPPKMPRREMRALVQELRQLLSVALMEHSSFGSDERTERIKQETAVYRDTWLVGPLRELIARYEPVGADDRG